MFKTAEEVYRTYKQAMDINHIPAVVRRVGTGAALGGLAGLGYHVAKPVRAPMSMRSQALNNESKSYLLNHQEDMGGVFDKGPKFSVPLSDGGVAHAHRRGDYVGVKILPKQRDNAGRQASVVAYKKHSGGDKSLRDFLGEAVIHAQKNVTDRNIGNPVWKEPNMFKTAEEVRHVYKQAMDINHIPAVVRRVYKLADDGDVHEYAYSDALRHAEHADEDGISGSELSKRIHEGLLRKPLHPKHRKRHRRGVAIGGAVLGGATGGLAGRLGGALGVPHASKNTGRLAGAALGAGTLLAVEHGMHRRNKGPAGDEEHAANMARHHRRLKNSAAMKRVADRTARSWLSSDGL